MARSGKHVKVDGLADAILDELKKNIAKKQRKRFTIQRKKLQKMV